MLVLVVPERGSKMGKLGLILKRVNILISLLNIAEIVVSVILIFSRDLDCSYGNTSQSTRSLIKMCQRLTDRAF